MKRIAVLTSGGDAPGMNAAIRAVVRTATVRDVEVLGIRRGYQGLLDDNVAVMGPRDVGGIIQLGGTVLGSARCPGFKERSGQQTALDVLRRHGVDGLVVIGGNGSQAGAEALARQGFPVVGVASTIDNDLFGSEITIGVDTALNVALEAIDRLKVTASSHHRAFVVEVMGRDCGYLALMAGIAGGAETILIPEADTELERVAQQIRDAYVRGKTHALVVVAEGAKHDATACAEFFARHQDRLGFDMRVTILGHVQRGARPGAFDRLLATRFGAAAVERLISGNHGVLVGLLAGTVGTTDLAEVVRSAKPLDLTLLALAHDLAR